MLAAFVTLESVFDVLWQASWQAMSLAAVVWIVLRVLRGQVAPRWRFVLWSLVFVRLGLPVMPSSPTSVFALWQLNRPTAMPRFAQDITPVKPEQPVPPQIVLEPRSPTFETRLESPSRTVPREVVNEAPRVSSVSFPAVEKTVLAAGAVHWHWKEVLLLPWILGVVTLLARRGWQQLRLILRLRKWSPLADPRINALLAQCCRRAGIRRRVILVATDDGTGPAIAGVLWPSLLIPRELLEDFTDEQLAMILRHELAHVRRNDLFMQELLMFLRAVHWFNPAAWFTLRKMELEREMACDEQVLADMDETSRPSYGRTLLQVLERGSAGMLSPGLLGTTDRLQQRFAAIRDYRRRSWKTTCLAASLIVLISVAGLTKPQAGEPAQIKQVSASKEAVPAAATVTTQPDVFGRCVDDAGQPLAGVKLVLILLEGQAQAPLRKWEQSSGQTGEFRFANLVALSSSSQKKQHYLLAASCPKHTSTYDKISKHRPTPKTGHQLKFSTKTGALSGRVTNERGEPLAGASVYFSSDDEALPGFRQSTTDAQGRYSISGLRRWTPGESTGDARTGERDVVTAVYFRIRHPQYPLMASYFSGIPQEVDVQMKPGVKLEGRVVDTVTGRPAAGVLMRAHGIDVQSEDEVVTDALGKYQINLFQGKFQLTVQSSDRLSVPLEVMSGAVGKVTQVPDLRLIVGGTIVGRVIDTITGKPLTRTIQGWRFSVGCQGPGAYSELSDEGTYKLRVVPGVTGASLQASLKMLRTGVLEKSMTSPKSPMFTIQEGETVTVDFLVNADNVTTSVKRGTTIVPTAEFVTVKPPRRRIPIELWGKRRVERPDTELGRALDDLELGAVDDDWGKIVRKVIEMGPAILPVLTADLDATENPHMIAHLAFILRGIGDRRALPALIRALPRTCISDEGSDCVRQFSDPQLAAFLRKHDVSDHDGENQATCSFGRPVNEVRVALQRLSGKNLGEDELAMVPLAGSPRQMYLQRSLYQRCAERWAAWWQQNWKVLGVDPAYAQVNLPAMKSDETQFDRFPQGKQFAFQPGVCNAIVQSVRNPKATYAFVDLDTGRQGGLPENLKSAAGSPERLDDILAWAAHEGYDIMGTEYTPPDSKKAHYVIRALGLTAWEYDVKRRKTLEKEIREDRPIDMGTRTNGLLARFDKARGHYVPEETAAFLFLTRDGTYGQMFVGVEVHDDNWKTDDSMPKEDELNPTGYTKGRRFSYSLIAKVPDETKREAVPAR